MNRGRALSPESKATVAAALFIIIVTPLFIFGVHLPRFVTPDTALDRATCERSRLTPPPPPGHLTVLVIDGLGFDYARQLPELDWLWRSAAARPLSVDYPSYTTPALLSFATGVGPQMSGVRLNAPTRPVTKGLDNLSATAADAGRAVDFFDGGWEPFGEIMFAPPESLWRGPIAMRASSLVSREASSLRFVYFGGVDEAGHEHGLASEAYRDNAIAASAHIRRFHQRLSDDDRLIVVSDHGHLPSGGHGGVEPDILRATFAIAGRDVRRGTVLEPRPLDDVASTIAVLAGIPTPACNMGQPMLDTLAIDASVRDALAAPAHDQLTSIANLKRPSDTRRPWRMLGMLASLAAMALVFRKRMPPAGSWLAPLAMVTVYATFLGARGYRLTFSKMPPQSAFISDAVIACVLSLVVTVAIARVRRWRQADVALVAATFGPMLAMAAWNGVDPHIVPPPYAGLAIILASPLMLGSAVTAVLIAFASTGVSAAPRPPAT